MRAGLQGFNLVRIERHFRVPERLPNAVTDVGREGAGTTSLPEIELTAVRILCYGDDANLPFFYTRREASGGEGWNGVEGSARFYWVSERGWKRMVAGRTRFLGT